MNFVTILFSNTDISLGGIKKNYIVELGGVKYESIEEAYTAATSHGYTLKLLQDMEITLFVAKLQ